MARIFSLVNSEPDLVQDVGDLRVPCQGILADDGHEEVRRKQVLVIVEHHEFVLRDLPVRGKAERDIDALRGERAITNTELGKIAEVLEVNAVHPRHAGQTIAAIGETAFGAKAQVLGDGAQIAQRLETVLRRGLGQHDNGVAVIDMGGREKGQVQVLFIVALDRLVDLIRGAGQIAFDDVRQGGTGVFGIKIDLAVQQGRVGDHGGAEIGPCLRLDAGGLQSLGIDLGDDELLGKVLASHANDLRMRGHVREGLR